MIFAFILIAAIFLFTKNIKQIKKNIFLGKPENRNDQPFQRFKNVLILALGQQKMFRKPLVAFLHLFIYIGFILINIEILEIIFDGLFGTHRILLDYIPPNIYRGVIDFFEILALCVSVACAIFLFRRKVFPVARLNHPDLKGFPIKDGVYILIFEIVLMLLFLTMNASDAILYPEKIGGTFIVSKYLIPFFSAFNQTFLTVINHGAWWLHIIGIFIFLNYVPYSKHLHIILAFPNAYYATLNPHENMQNMPHVQQEVLYSIQPELAPTNPVEQIPKFGAKDVTDLSWKNLLDAYSCTECGRCTAACPANITGKLLSPRKIMMATRDRADELGNFLKQNPTQQHDLKLLLGNYISVEELRACTTCNACVTECPVSISPLAIIIELRRALIMEDSNAPKEWNAMFSNIENNFSPWKISSLDRTNWIK